MLVALLLPLNLLSIRRFHHDEALYATWALAISSGQNPWLVEVPVDKPPLFIYTVAGAFWLLGPGEVAARLPSLLATVAMVGLTFALGRRLYGAGVGLVAAWLVALSPFTIAFAPTALTDPMLVAWGLAACLAAASGQAVWAGLAWGLAIGTKQQGLFFGPLIAGLLILFSAEGSFSRQEAKVHFGLLSGKLLNFGVAVAVTILPTLLWDLARHQSPGVWQLSLINYGGLSPETMSPAERLWGFLDLLALGTSSKFLNIGFLAGLPLLLIYSGWQIWKNGRVSLSSGFGSAKSGGADWLLTLFVVSFLVGHSLLSFQVWDRYLLGLIPLLVLLLARVLVLPALLLRWGRPNLPPLMAWLGGVALVVLLGLTLSRPVSDAVNGRYPLGSNSAALSGLEQITAYLQGHAGANTTLYHRWLGTHWRFYLWGYPYDLQYWASSQALAAKARPGHLIAFPAWRSETEARLALAAVGLRLTKLTQSYTAAGYPSITLYRIDLIEP